MRFSTSVGLLLLCLFVFTGVAMAASGDTLEKENAELHRRVDNLEKELQEIKALLTNEATVASAQKARPQRELSDAELSRIASLVRTGSDGKSPVLSSLDMEVYGYIKLDASYDTSRSSPGNYVKWVDSEATNKNDDEFNMTANQTRLGFKISGPEDDGLKVSGKVEVDFYEANLCENKAGIMMRHAFMKLDWPQERFNIIAGQTWDVFSPLNPGTLNYSVQWYSGNTGYRRPQIRLTKGFALGDDVDVTVAGAVARTIGDSAFMGDDTITESGEDSGKPTFQGRAGFTFPSPLGYKKTTVGVSGHWGEEEFDTSAVGGHSDVESWSVNLDVHQPVNQWLTIKGELFSGANMDAYCAGIGQGINDSGKAIATKGGWVAASLGPWDKWRFNVGLGIEDVEDNDVDAGDRTFNRSLFGNVLYDINKNTQVGFELTQWDTKRKGESDADNVRGQMSLIYKF
ncbi:MAG TPA: hypothetical protein ENH94_06920 [Phycisphaerales bacterium]|nr:hypothetical protein [Phycisphaerales bacterium]